MLDTTRNTTILTSRLRSPFLFAEILNICEDRIFGVTIYDYFNISMIIIITRKLSRLFSSFIYGSSGVSW